MSEKSDNLLVPGASHTLLDKMPPVQIFYRHLEIKSPLSVFLLSLLGAMLLYISFAPFDCWYLGYFALVPWLLAVCAGKGRKKSLLFGYLGGLGFWLLAIYWIMLPTVGGYIAGSVYLGLYWLIAAAVFRFAYNKNFPMWLVVPVVWTALEFARSNIVSFPWFLLGQSQYRQLPLIQISDITGQLGVTFMLGMVNGLLVDLMTGPLFCKTKSGARVSRQSIRGLIFTVLVFASAIAYGYFRIDQRKSTVQNGPVVGVVQDNIPVMLGGRIIPAELFLNRHVEKTIELFNQPGKPCEVVVWPETMLIEGMNHEFWELDVKSLSTDEAISLGYRTLGYPYMEALKKRLCDRISQVAGRKIDLSKALADTVKLHLARRIGKGDVYRFVAPAFRSLLLKYGTPTQWEKFWEKKLTAITLMIFDRQKGIYSWETADYLGAEPGVKELSLILQIFKSPDDFDSLSKKHASLSDAQKKSFENFVKYLTYRKPGAKFDFAQLVGLIKDAREKLLRDDRTQIYQSIRVPVLKAQVAKMFALSYWIDCPILAGGSSYRRNPRARDKMDLWCTQNSVLVFVPCKRNAESYSKQHLVPFSESVPFKYSWPGAHDILRSLVPPGMPQLEPGQKQTAFDVAHQSTPKSDIELVSVVTPICFEGTIPSVCRKLVEKSKEQGKPVVMVNISNDGWFTHLKGWTGFWDSVWLKRSQAKTAQSRIDAYQGTVEQAQHMTHSVFRAIENRVPVVRAVNTGISVEIDSNGKIGQMVKSYDPDSRKKTMVAGELKVSTNTDSRVTMYAYIGNTFAVTVSGFAVCIVLLLLIKPRRESAAEINKSGEND